MIRNVGTFERVVRLVVGVALLGLYGAISSPWRNASLLGLLPLGTALTGRCPVYRAFGRRVTGDVTAGAGLRTF